MLKNKTAQTTFHSSPIPFIICTQPLPQHPIWFRRDTQAVSPCPVLLMHFSLLLLPVFPLFCAEGGSGTRAHPQIPQGQLLQTIPGRVWIQLCSPHTGAAPSLEQIFLAIKETGFFSLKNIWKINELAKVYLLCARSYLDLRIHPSNKAHYEDPKEGEVVLSRKSKRSSAFSCTEMESKRTWTLIVHLSKSSTTKWEKLFNQNKAILAYKMSGYRLDMHRLEIKFLMDGKSGRTSQKQQRRHKAH